MYKLTRLNVANLIYIGLLSLFILFYFQILQPIKIGEQCAESSAKATLRLTPVNAFDYYQGQYKDCLSKNSELLNKLILAVK